MPGTGTGKPAGAAFACLKKCLKLIAKFWDEHEAVEQLTGVCLARLVSAHWQWQMALLA